jgi:putative addiction module CopG family antidote
VAARAPVVPHLGQAWLKNPEDVLQRTEEKKRVPWNGYWFVNVGEGRHRTWEDNVKYSCIGAGQGEKYSRPLLKSQAGDEVLASMGGLGYGGYGRVTTPAVPIAEFRAADGETLLSKPLKAQPASVNSDDPKLSEWAVGVKWEKTVPKEQAKTFQGVFANPNIVCKLRHPETVEFVRREFLLQGARQTKRLALAVMTILAISCHLWQGDHEGRCPMQSMNISLPDPLKQYVDGQILAGRYSSASEYVRELIRADEKRKAEEQLEAKLLEGLNRKAIRKEALAKVEARKHTR